MRYIFLIIVAAFLLTACVPITEKPVACTMEAKLCPDGSAVGRTGPNCEFAPCPKQNNTNENNTTTIVMGEPGPGGITEDCMELYDPINQRNFWRCPQNTTEQTAQSSTFKEYKSQNKTMCMAMRFTCDGAEFFSDESGCGCIHEHTPADSACTMDYTPVCGWFNESIQCFAYPCAQTFGNLCGAATDSKVAHTTFGECPAVGGKKQAIDCPENPTYGCTKEYNPVCGQIGLNSGGIAMQTYSNGCVACNSLKVISYTEGACA